LRRRIYWMVALALVGCSVSPEPEVPIVVLPKHIRGFQPGDGNSFGDEPWRRLFTDARLRHLIDGALERNPTLLAAEARVRESRALAGVADAPGVPRVDAYALAKITRLSFEENPGGPFGDRDRSPMGFGVATSWEIDWWGRIQRGRQAAEAEWLAADHHRAALRTQIVSAVAGCYVDLVSLDEQLGLARAVSQLEQQRMDWLQKRLLGGQGDARLLNRAEVSKRRAELAATRLEEAIIIKENELRSWCGDFPGKVTRGRSLEVLNRQAGIGRIGSRAIIRRPDVCEAAWRHQAAMARLGVAEALRWPEVQLTASTGVLTSAFSNLLASGASGYAIGPSMSAPLLDGGASRSRVAAAAAGAEATRQNFEATLVKALREVADALTSFHQAERTDRQALEIVENLGESVAIARRREASGESDRGEVIDRQLEQTTAQTEWLKERRRQQIAMIDLYRALGGGWK